MSRRLILVGLVAMLGLGACTDTLQAKIVITHTDTIVTRHYEVIATNGWICRFTRAIKDTLTIKPGDSVPCIWDQDGY